jgi:hypothetical protein
MAPSMLAAVAVVAFAAAVTGDSLGYLIGRAGGRRLVLRYGRFVRLTSQRLDKVETFMARHGPKVVAIARFVEGCANSTAWSPAPRDAVAPVCAVQRDRRRRMGRGMGHRRLPRR